MRLFHVELPKAPQEWQDSDRTSLARFLKTESGAKMLQKAHAVQYQNAIAACTDVVHTAHSAGRADGMREMLLWLESLSQPAATQQENDADKGPMNQPEPSEIRRF